MTSFTSRDNRYMSMYVRNQKTVFRRNELLRRAPHIGSHTVMRVWRCTDEYVYRDPVELDPLTEEIYERDEKVKHQDWISAVSELADTAVVTEWKFDEIGCNSISCNPYYPGGNVCADGLQEEPFAFTTGHNQRIDACQPVCYDKDQPRDTYVGMMSLYAKSRRLCYVVNPELLAFYLDPHRRAFGEKSDFIEASAFEIKSEYWNREGAPVVVARIGEDYCAQYGLDYVEEQDDTDGNILYGGCKVDKNEGGYTALSTWTGHTVTRAYNFGSEAFLKLIKTTSSPKKKNVAAPTKGPTTQPYVANKETWLNNVDVTKKPLPFPLKLSQLGLDEETSNGLLWTDEYSYINDGRNDVYGGRLVEKPRDVTRPPRSTVADPAGNSEYDSIISAAVDGSVSKSNGSDLFARNFGRSVDDYKNTVRTLSGLKDVVGGSSFETMVNQIVAGTTVDTVADLFGRSDNTVGLTRNLGLLMRRVGKSGVTVGTEHLAAAMTQTALRTNIESRAVTTVSSLLKLPFRALSRGLSVLSAVSLLGVAVDLFSAFVYDPFAKYNHYMSDRLLRALAKAELAVTQRLIGHQQLLLEPSEWMVNTRYFNRFQDSMYDTLLGVMYTRARRVNSDGSIIYWYKRGGIFHNDDGKIFYFDESVAALEIGYTESDLDGTTSSTNDTDRVEKAKNVLTFNGPGGEPISLCLVLLFIVVTAVSTTVRQAGSQSLLFLGVFATSLLMLFGRHPKNNGTKSK